MRCSACLRAVSGVLVFLFCLVDDAGDGGVARDVEAGAEHVEDSVDAGNECKAFERSPTDWSTMASMMRPAPGTPAVPMEARVPVRTIIIIWSKVSGTPNTLAMKMEQTPI